ncbi:hypothetical protein HPB51_021677 [Rhipicephalus microplus]|uniref:Uncharacterized protein n=1 Tax=Rhipicephalus microplus TaxID=6941 RepID=A0A9J6D7W7_RHIMP|nr:hypothetical protein HPB51_021677 [Rhipicephalus microplus]
MNTRLINEAKVMMESAYSEKITSLIEWLQGNNSDLDKVKAELEELIPKDEFATECEAVLTYQDAVLEMPGQLKAREWQLRQTYCSTTFQSLPTRPPQTPEDRTPRNDIKLLTLQLQTFDGQLYHVFVFGAVRTTAEENKHLTKGEKFKYLKTLLEGDAAAAISRLQATAECYDDANKILRSRFGDNQHIVQHHLRRLRTLQAVDSSEDLYNLRKLLDYVQCHIRGLKGLNVSPASYANMMTHILLKALPTDIVVVYYQKKPTEGHNCLRQTMQSRDNSMIHHRQPQPKEITRTPEVSSRGS